MALVDTNVWLAIALPTHIFHDASSQWFAGMGRTDKACLCRASQLSLLRLLTTKSVLAVHGSMPMTNEVAWTWMEDLMLTPRVALLPEPPNLQSHFASFARRGTPSPKLWMDAYLAAFAVAAGMELVTTDQAFAQFRGLQATILP